MRAMHSCHRFRNVGGARCVPIRADDEVEGTFPANISCEHFLNLFTVYLAGADAVAIDAMDSCLVFILFRFRASEDADAKAVALHRHVLFLYFSRFSFSTSLSYG